MEEKKLNENNMPQEISDDELDSVAGGTGVEMTNLVYRKKTTDVNIVKTPYKGTLSGGKTQGVTGGAKPRKNDPTIQTC
jgi:hypothetical protein